MANTDIVDTSKNELNERELKEINSYLDSLGSRLPDHQKTQFVSICRQFKLNPFLREIHGVPFNDKFNIIVGYEVYLKRAERSGLLNGWHVWTEGSGQNLIAKIRIHRKDREYPFEHEVEYSEYVQTFYNKKSGKTEVNSFWRSKPKTMIKKVCIAQAFRLCFPEHLGGMPYTPEEIIPDYGENQTPKVEPENESQVPNWRKKNKSKPPKFVSDEAQDAEYSKPNEEENQIKKIVSPEDMKQEVFDVWGTDKLFVDFLIHKKWIKGGQTMENLTENQIERLYRNMSSILGLYDRFKAWKGGQNG